MPDGRDRARERIDPASGKWMAVVGAQADSDGWRIGVASASAQERAFLACVLEAAGHRVGLAEDGERLRESLQHGLCDLALVDDALPGLDALRGLSHRSGGSVPLIALVRPGEADAPDAHGFDGHLPRPVEAAGLVAELQLWRGRADPVWDGAVYREVADLLGPVRAGEALDLFEVHLQAGLALVRDMPGDRERLAREAHGLVAMAGMLGFTDLSRASRRLMEHDRSASSDRQVRDLERAAARALASLRGQQEENAHRPPS